MIRVDAMNHTSPRNHGEQGAALLALLGMMMVGGTTALLGMANQKSYIAKNNNHDSMILAKAKEALIAYALQEAAQNPQKKTRLPCPAIDDYGSAAGSCASASAKVGLLPWKELGLDHLRDSTGESLWYAVSNDYVTPVDPNTTLGNLTVTNGASSNVVAVIFAPGKPLSAQTRPAAPALPTDGDLNNFLESDNIDNDTGFEHYAVSWDWSKADTSNDMALGLTQSELKKTIALLPGAPPPNGTVTFTLTSSVLAGTTFSDKGNTIQTNEGSGSDAGTVDLGIVANNVGCLWFDQSAFQLEKRTTRIHFKIYTSAAEDDTVTSYNYGEGFTFAIVQTKSKEDLEKTCGEKGGGNGFSNLGSDTQGMALEVDYYPRPDEKDPPFNHAAFLFAGKKQHGQESNPTCDPDIDHPGCDYDQINNNVIWLEDQAPHHIRMEIHTGYTSSACTTTDASGSHALLKAWLDCSNCSDTTQDLASAAAIQTCYQLPIELLGDPANPSGDAKGVVFGFTVETCKDDKSCTHQSTNVSDFSLATSANE